jgi:hypothetical protein
MRQGRRRDRGIRERAFISRQQLMLERPIKRLAST